MLDDIALPTNHGGIVFPLDMFRPTMLAAALADALVSQARNILDAKLVLIRHAEVQLVLVRIEGSVIGDDPAAFWRENPELGLVASQVLPRQLFQYWVEGGDEPRQGFIVAQRGQALAAQDATKDQLPPEATAADWPVNQLLAQLQIDGDELAGDFPGGPRVELSLVDREGDDREILMTLIGQQDPDAEGGPEGAAEGSEGAAAEAKPKRVSVEADQKRRAAEQQAEEQARRAKAETIQADLPYVLDELGVVVAPKQTELADADILERFLARELEGDIPRGLPRELQRELQGKRVDFAVPVEFLSEVFVADGPLTKSTFEAEGEPRTIGGAEVRVLEVLGPRLGKGSFVRRERAGVFISRTPDLPLPDELIVSLLDQQS
jgi:hypothetical protein